MEGTEDLTGNKLADKITSVDKKKKVNKNKNKKTNEIGEIYIPPEKKTTIV